MKNAQVYHGGGQNTSYFPSTGGSGAGDHKVLVDVSDTTPDYLSSKLDGGAGIQLNIENPGANEKIQIVNLGIDSKKVLVNVLDTTPGWLIDKLLAGTGIILTIENPGGNEYIKVDNSLPDDKKVLVDASDTTPGFLSSKLSAADGITLTIENPAGNENLQIGYPDDTVAGFVYIDGNRTDTYVETGSVRYPFKTINAATYYAGSQSYTQVVFIIATATYPERVNLHHITQAVSTFQCNGATINLNMSLDPGLGVDNGTYNFLDANFSSWLTNTMIVTRAYFNLYNCNISNGFVNYGNSGIITFNIYNATLYPFSVFPTIQNSSDNTILNMWSCNIGGIDFGGHSSKLTLYDCEQGGTASIEQYANLITKNCSLGALSIANLATALLKRSTVYGAIALGGTNAVITYEDTRVDQAVTIPVTGQNLTPSIDEKVLTPDIGGAVTPFPQSPVMDVVFSSTPLTVNNINTLAGPLAHLSRRIEFRISNASGTGQAVTWDTQYIFSPDKPNPTIAAHTMAIFEFTFMAWSVGYPAPGFWLCTNITANFPNGTT